MSEISRYAGYRDDEPIADDAERIPGVFDDAPEAPRDQEVDFFDGTVPTTHDSGVIGLHNTNLFDQDERVSDGALYDEATGEPYDNSTSTDEKYFEGPDSIGHIIDPNGIIPDTPDEVDAFIDELLRDHDL
jgi:hypothetical protein